jgi:hypothetical protein
MEIYKFSFLAGTRDSSLLSRVHTGTGAHLSSDSLGTSHLSVQLKHPGREADHLFPPDARFKNKWSYTSCPVYQWYSTWSTRTPGVHEDMLGIRKIKKKV